MSVLSDEELQAYKKAFDHFDKNKDGTINITELGEVMKSLGKDPSQEELTGNVDSVAKKYGTRNVNKKCLSDMINNVDLDGNTVLDFKEFSMMMTNQTVRLSFSLKCQHANLMNTNLFQSDSDSNAELRQVFAIFDRNGDGQISK